MTMPEKLSSVVGLARRNEMLWLAAWERKLAAETPEDEARADVDIAALVAAGQTLAGLVGRLAGRVF